jgi:hypothetical protein
MERAMSYRVWVLIAAALLLSGCEIGLFYGDLPSNFACRDADALPGQPISNDCLDTLGH